MGRQVADTLPAARELYDRAAAVLGYDLAKVCFEGPVERLDTTQVSQPALYVTSLAALELLRRDRPEAAHSPAATAGLSLGEYTALAAAGAMDFETGLRLVQERGLAMQAAADAVPSGMVSILGLELNRVEELCREAAQGDVLQVANHLCPGNIAVSGTKAACERVVQLAEGAGAMRAVPLAVAGAFHTPIMQPAVERLRAAIDAATIRRPRCPVISNVDARPHDDPAEIRALLLAQITAPVRWEDSMRWLLDQRIDEFLEVGPGRVLRGLLKRIDRKARCGGVPE
jgi:[acyl-carrier-protein] S-malonyltransferase